MEEWKDGGGEKKRERERERERVEIETNDGMFNSREKDISNNRE